MRILDQKCYIQEIYNFPLYEIKDRDYRLTVLYWQKYGPRMISLFVLFACSPRIIRYPGTLSGLGRQQLDTESRSLEKSLETTKKEEKVVPNAEKRRTRKPRKRQEIERKIPVAARSFLGARTLKYKGEVFRYDCSGFVTAVYHKVGVPLSGSTKTMYALAKEKRSWRRKPQVGDVAFFDNTHDRNKNGRFDDPLTHVAVVEYIEPNGRMTLIHLGNKGVKRMYMNLQQPNIYKDKKGDVQNTYLRYRKSKKDKTPRLAGQLSKGFGYFDYLSPKR